ncbi:MAG: hypothetical protein OQL28_00190 [Sedimenticola sp.]|nr:hypothetical protein [Sedimenticola sp.]
MNTTDNSLLRLVAMYFSPFALPHLSAPRDADRSERRRIHRLNLLHLRPFLRRYIFRSGQLVVACFIFALLFSSLLPFPLLALAACAGILLSILHTALLIFMQQSANDIASRSRPGNKEIER